MVATPAAKKLGHRIAPRRWASARRGWTKPGTATGAASGTRGGIDALMRAAFPSSGSLLRARRAARPALRQRPDVSRSEARTGYAEQGATPGHRATAPRAH